MKAKTIISALVLCIAAATAGFAQNPQVGTWKLDEAKSKLAAGVPKNHTVTYEAAGDMTKVIVDGTDASGAATHNEWSGKFDGADYTVTGDPTADTRAYTKEGTHTLLMTIKKGGKVTITGRIVVAPDGKTRTITTTGTDANGKKFEQVGVYNKA